MRAFIAPAAALSLAALAWAGPAAAAPVPPACSTLSVTTSTACQTMFDNNDSAADMNGFGGGVGVFGNNDWTLADRDETFGASSSTSFKLEGLKDAKSGTWSVASFGGYTKAALVMKAGSVAWVAYLLDITKLSGTWSTADIRVGGGGPGSGGRQPNLSHITLYVADPGTVTPPPPPAPAPLPAAGWLLVAGLGALVAVRRKSA